MHTQYNALEEEKYRVMTTHVALHVGKVSIEGPLQQQGTKVVGDTVESTGGDNVYPCLLSLLPVLCCHLLHELGYRGSDSV